MTIKCKGGEGSLGHPLIYLAVNAKGDVVCPYCGTHYSVDKKDKNE